MRQYESYNFLGENREKAELRQQAIRNTLATKISD